MSVLDIESLSVNIAERHVLQDLSLHVSAGEVLAVVGPNGAGKTTLIRAISGVQPALSGKVLVAQQDAATLAPHERARLMAVVPQARQLPAEFSVYQTVLFGRTPYLNWLGKVSKVDRDKVMEALEATHTIDIATRLVGSLSGGEQQRVLLARALVQEAPLLLLDEPITHLDLQHQSILLNLIEELSKSKGFAVLMVLHDLNLAGLYANRILMLVNGAVYASGTPAEVVTAENLATVYNIHVNVISHPQYGTPLVLPDGRMP
jgi:iron complex transport system ATP-binding protein